MERIFRTVKIIKNDIAKNEISSQQRCSRKKM